jgi:hypothetical protein
VGGKLVLELDNLPLKQGHPGRKRLAIRIIRLGGGRIVEQGIPLLPHVPHVLGRLAEYGEKQQQQAGRPSRGSHNITHVEPLAM